MSFWENVDSELKFIGMERKELGKIAGFPESYISKGITRKSCPNADLALRIAKALNVSIEYLVTGKKGEEQSETGRVTPQIVQLITKLNKFSSKQKQIFFDLAEVIDKN
ncbi:MAG: helix-turn-helix domain containing protein [Treponema sp.]|nr:helix-turn-helix domain containing protein [Treponema sp.]